MGALTLAKVGYDIYMKWLWPLLAILFAVTCAFVGIAVGTRRTKTAQGTSSEREEIR